MNHLEALGTGLWSSGSIDVFRLQILNNGPKIVHSLEVLALYCPQSMHTLIHSFAFIFITEVFWLVSMLSALFQLDEVSQSWVPERWDVTQVEGNKASWNQDASFPVIWATLLNLQVPLHIFFICKSGFLLCFPHCDIMRIKWVQTCKALLHTCEVLSKCR